MRKVVWYKKLVAFYMWVQGSTHIEAEAVIFPGNFKFPRSEYLFDGFARRHKTLAKRRAVLLGRRVARMPKVEDGIRPWNFS